MALPFVGACSQAIPREIFTRSREAVSATKRHMERRAVGLWDLCAPSWRTGSIGSRFYRRSRRSRRWIGPHLKAHKIAVPEFLQGSGSGCC